ncbi:tRNA (adenosine(37)-N6)-threonylcarbamoyltransferase complex ATPase subunit type 1 TsaE [Marinivivus vitaminiproducens]|uniref:tRNA (adenosine(37)-N6)-threonylcarbamoyltransferase complex ATPase subunit type 1 TsaE n=1 Tax=Marinivivus vitaminiproducens TaxID=3035935 RepID=UPI0027993F55|nr:tRNA (adenosine(37)-N6)-threonylcarbamoyltransferase complex ATPase subunit type 1 TsaE [Geminicoccaceae bacterium SCSIO 64248]
MPIVVPLPDEEATIALGRRLAALLRPGDLVTLAGDLGVGKTALARAVIQARAGAPIDVPSPTFTLVQHYPLDGLDLWHADLYRIDDAADAQELGLEDAWTDGALLVEWADRLGSALPADRMDVAIELRADGGRTAVIEAGPGWHDRLSALGA